MADVDPVTVGVLSLHTSKETKAILNAVEDLGHETEWLRTENTSVSVTGGSVVLEPDVDVIANRMLLSNTEHPAEELGLANTFAQLVPTLNEPTAVLTAIHKLSTATTLAANDVRTPDVTLALSSDTLNATRDRYGEEAVYKTAIGTHGGGTWKVGPDDPVNAMVGNRYAFLQELVEQEDTRHRDVRVYVVGGEVVAAMYRYAPDNDWRTNVALGGSVEDATDDLPEDAKEMARRASSAVGLDYAGVDLVEGDEGWFVLEVNPTAGFKGLYQATDVSPAPYIAKLAIERAGGSVDDDRVQELSTILDDTRPTAQPSKPAQDETDPVIIGYIEEVVLSGTSGSASVLAKSDTGATRTSIDTSLAAEIGAGPIKSITRVKSGSSKTARSRPVVDVVVGIGGNRHTVTASVEDRSHMDYQVLLGRDILSHYQVDVSRRTDGDDGDTPEEEE
ncbi:RimK family alpha-L-glutamate ligase [Natrarchaeobaculum sulfurireducens]|uniref:Glutathione synthase/glutaminyl transferase/alpha-L-glutamate ligase n=1 Tax=Natrarchaeobaculum sulfurireducens TaxID=2044521 RepID=A0A346PGF2_9EURY|nr:RimK family alpha-L-glutamate ligase [Natrarchaeobaculum sulfurireducens]AXR78597.1 Glutathione synthase/glutaminyl transferase/alpha-L-glutamate ligase [Natrarchaeobaculum sulfurireducens]AXR81352.1 lysine biosynthesis regulator / ribosomal protein S6 modification enzyme(glutaminyl transferase) [Natrarchaeobaculum sulfurireducens]